MIDFGKGSIWRSCKSMGYAECDYALAGRKRMLEDGNWYQQCSRCGKWLKSTVPEEKK